MSTLSKLSLANALQIRQMKAIVISNYRFDTTSAVVVQGKATTNGYADAVKAYTGTQDDKVRTIGVPHILLWNTLVKVAQELAAAHHAPATALLANYITQGEAMGPRTS